MSMADDGQPSASQPDPARPSADPDTSPQPAEQPPAEASEPAGEPVAAPPPAPSAPGGPGETPPEEPAEPEPQPETLIDAIADLLQMFVNWLRQEAAGVMRDKVILPLQQLGFTLFSACAAVTLFVIGLCFLFVALLLVLARYLGWPLALTVVGVAILIGAGIFTYRKWRSTQT